MELTRLTFRRTVAQLPPMADWLTPAPALPGMDAWIGWGFPAETLLVVGLSFTAAVFSWYCIERPCLRLKERLSASGSLPQENASANGGQSQRPQVAA